MRGLAGAALLLLLASASAAARWIPTDDGPELVSAALTSITLSIPSRGADPGRDLTLYLDVFESSSVCGPARVQINGEIVASAVRDDGSSPPPSRVVIDIDGIPLAASLAFSCVEDRDGEPLEQVLRLGIESYRGFALEQGAAPVGFTARFRQLAPVRIYRVETIEESIYPGAEEDQEEQDEKEGQEGQEEQEEQEEQQKLAGAVAQADSLRAQIADLQEQLRKTEFMIEKTGSPPPGLTDLGSCRSLGCVLDRVMSKGPDDLQRTSVGRCLKIILAVVPLAAIVGLISRLCRCWGRPSSADREVLAEARRRRRCRNRSGSGSGSSVAEPTPPPRPRLSVFRYIFTCCGLLRSSADLDDEEKRQIVAEMREQQQRRIDNPYESESEMSSTMEEDLARLREAAIMVSNMIAVGAEARSVSASPSGGPMAHTTTRERPGIATPPSPTSTLPLYERWEDTPPEYTSQDELDDDEATTSIVSDGFRGAPGPGPSGAGSARRSSGPGPASPPAGDELGYSEEGK